MKPSILLAAIALQPALSTTFPVPTAMAAPATGTAIVGVDGTFNTVAGWSGINGTKTIETENGNRFLRFKNEKPEDVVAVEGRIPLQPTWKNVTMSVKMRGTIGAKGKEGWYAPRLTFQFKMLKTKWSVTGRM
jgi:hypothetical protein